jgi:hypothetical protein
MEFEKPERVTEVEWLFIQFYPFHGDCQGERLVPDFFMKIASI